MSCSKCGRCGCDCGVLPYAIQASVTGLDGQDLRHYYDCPLSITATFGSGASAVVSGPGGEPDFSPAYPDFPQKVQAVVYRLDDGRRRQVELDPSPDAGPLEITLERGGCGYAVLGRVQPSLSAEIQSADPDVRGRGFGAVLDVVVALSSEKMPKWSVSSIAVTGGVGYATGDNVVIVASPGTTTEQKFNGTLVTKRTMPDVELTIYSRSCASGDAVLKPEISEVPCHDGHAGPCWGIAGINYLSRGYGYLVGDVVRAQLVADIRYSRGELPIRLGGGQYVARVAEIGPNGEIQRVDSITGTGSFYRDDEPSGVVIQEPGIYYQETADAAPIVADIKVTAKCDPSAVISAAVETDVTSPRFGQIVSLSVDHATESLLMWHWLYESGGSSTGLKRKKIEKADGTYLLVADDPVRTVGVTVDSRIGSGACITLDPCPDGSAQPINELKVTSGGSGYARLGRKPPSIAILPPVFTNPANTTTATFVPHIQKSQGLGGLDVWSISSVDVGGECHRHSRSRMSWANVDITAPDGFGARFNVTFSPGPPQTCGGTESIDSISAQCGTGYVVGQHLIFKFTDDVGVVVQPIAQIVAVDQSGNPTIAVLEQGAFFCNTWFKTPPGDWVPSEELWKYTNLRVTAANAGGKDGASSKSRFIEERPAVLVIEADVFGNPTGVTVLDGGAYYAESQDLPPIEAPATAVIEQIPPSNGSGAEISLVVEKNPYSDKFGQITDAVVTNGGAGYVFYGASRKCNYTHREYVVFPHRNTQLLIDGNCYNQPPTPQDVVIDMSMSVSPPRANFFTVAPSGVGLFGYSFTASAPAGDCRDFSMSFVAASPATGNATLHIVAADVLHVFDRECNERGQRSVYDTRCNAHRCDCLECIDDSDCVSRGGCCRDNVCISPCPECWPPCPDGTCCHEGQCTTPGLYTCCIVDADCGEGYRCRRGECDRICPDVTPPPPPEPVSFGPYAGCCLKTVVECEKTNGWQWVPMPGLRPGDSCLLDYTFTGNSRLTTTCARSYFTDYIIETEEECAQAGGSFTPNANCFFLAEEEKFVCDPMGCCVTSYWECVMTTTQRNQCGQCPGGFRLTHENKCEITSPSRDEAAECWPDNQMTDVTISKRKVFFAQPVYKSDYESWMCQPETEEFFIPGMQHPLNGIILERNFEENICEESDSLNPGRGLNSRNPLP